MITCLNFCILHNTLDGEGSKPTYFHSRGSLLRFAIALVSSDLAKIIIGGNNKETKKVLGHVGRLRPSSPDGYFRKANWTGLARHRTDPEQFGL
ncbi:hypothetical protein PoB_000858000 [Plakobranchus ocellatus]|uniref:Uncharacterized protein n=1 Tax=Plakobranchus ocellatus TaxID=259542 RepID=A0AAV3YHS5_9GAST|nr:hypothetical protein PoB_000858000 [Plakobranchus ocellatus]